MCYVDAYGKLHPLCSDSVSSGYDIPLLGGTTKDMLKYLYNTLNFIGTWLQIFEKKNIFSCK